MMKADIRSYLWQGDRPWLTFTYPGFDCGSHGGTPPGSRFREFALCRKCKGFRKLSCLFVEETL